MKYVLIALVLCAACSDKSELDKLKEKNPPPEPTAAPPPPPPKAVAAVDAAVAPDPTTPADIDHARNQAMIDGRDKDVLHFCDLGKLDDKSNPQALLGCTLSACRLKDQDNAKKYGHALPKLLMDQAIKVCASQQVTL